MRWWTAAQFTAAFVLALVTRALGATAPDPTITIEGIIVSPREVGPHADLVLRTEDGLEYRIELGRLLARPTVLRAGDRVLVTGSLAAGPNRVVATDIALAPPAASGWPAAGGRHRVAGTVEAVSGSTAALRAADGSTIAVDIARIPPAGRRMFAVGERVVVVGSTPVPGARLVTAAQVFRDPSPAWAR